MTTSYFTLQDAENSGAVRRIRHDCLCPALCVIMAQNCRALKTKKFHFGNWSKGMSEKYSITGKVTGILREDTVSDNETSGDKLLWFERMVWYQWGCSRQPPAGEHYLERGIWYIYMDDKKLLRYSMQLSMLKQLLSKKLINETEYQILQKRLMKDYGIVSNVGVKK